METNEREMVELTRGGAALRGFKDLSNHDVREAWRVARRAGWAIDLLRHEDQRGVALVVEVSAEPEHDVRPPYIRQQMSVAGKDLGGVVRGVCAVAPLSAVADVSLSIFVLNDTGQRVAQGNSARRTIAGHTVLNAEVKLDNGTVILPDAGYEVVYQLNLLAPAKLQLRRVALSTFTNTRAEWRPSIAFFSFGDVAKASSRLRVFKLADELRVMGCEVAINPPVDRETRFDIAVFQKVRPFEKANRLRANGALLVYDMDDNYLLDEQGTRGSVVAFINLVHRVTVGSRRILEEVSRYHPRVCLFENPIDLLAEDGPSRKARGECRRIGWFGAPENRYQLDDLGLSDIVTITRGGDLEWSLQTVDASLMDLDLVVLPVSATEWNLSKNANRMIKALGLGVPVLASNTQEHRAVAQSLGLPEWILVSGTDRAAWDAAIDRARREYGALERAIGSVQARVRKEHSAARIAHGWLDRLAPPAPSMPASPDPRRPVARWAEHIHVLLIDWRGVADSMGWIRSTRRVVGDDARVVYATIADAKSDARLASVLGLGEMLASEPLKLFSELDSYIQSLSPNDRILVLPHGFVLTPATGVVLTDDVAPEADLVFLGSNPGRAGPDPLPRTPLEAADSFWRFEEPGPTLALAGTARRLALTFGALRDHWAWAALHVGLFVDPSRVWVSPVPCSVRERPLQLPRFNAIYRAASRRMEGVRNGELANEFNQWQRMQEDLIVEVAHLIPDAYRPLLMSRAFTALSTAREKVRRPPEG